jgi:hypothetical protein
MPYFFLSVLCGSDGIGILAATAWASFAVTADVPSLTESPPQPTSETLKQIALKRQSARRMRTPLAKLGFRTDGRVRFHCKSHYDVTPF